MQRSALLPIGLHNGNRAGFAYISSLTVRDRRLRYLPRLRLKGGEGSVEENWSDSCVVPAKIVSSVGF